MKNSEGSEMKKTMLIATLVALVAVSCAAGDESGQASPGPDDSQTLPTVPPGGGDEGEIDPILEPGDTAPPSDDSAEDLSPGAQRVADLVGLAKADLAERLDVDADDVELASAEAVTWRDGSLGCPEPGMSYTQALVDGHRFELVVDGEGYWYHQGGSSDPRFCVDPKDPAPSPDV